MKSNKKATASKSNAVLLVVIAILAVALIVVTVIAILPKSQDEPSGGTTTVTTIPTITIKTPYCVIKYPEQWKDQMTVKETTTADGVLSEAFYANLSDGQYALFTIFFGDSKNGELFGYLTVDDVKTAVYIECYPLSAEDITVSEIDIFYSMLEGVNEVAQSIAACEEYSPSPL